MIYPIRDAENSKVFTAESGLDYKIILQNSSGYFPVPQPVINQILSVSLSHMGDEVGDHDEAIMNTVLDYLFSILMENPTVVFSWICADGDGLEYRRHRYFNFLFIRGKRTGLGGLRPEVITSDIRKVDNPIKDNGKLQYASIVLRESNPHYDEIVAGFNLLKDEVEQGK
jgi:hypothetical protein